MTKNEKAKRKEQLMFECLGIYLVGNLDELNKNVRLLCNKYFPNCSEVFVNTFYIYFSDMRGLYYGYDCCSSEINKYDELELVVNEN